MTGIRAFVVGLLVGAGAMVPIVYAHDQSQTKAIADARSEVKVAKALRAAAIESVTVYVPVVAAAKAESDRLGALVQLVGPTTIAVRTTPGDSSPAVLVTVPATIVKKMRADSATIAKQAVQIARLTTALAADSVAIQRQAVLIQTLGAKRRCGPKCGAAIAVGVLVVVKLGSSLLPTPLH